MALKRSVINRTIARAEEVIAHFGFHLPPFAYWTPEEWEQKGHECDEIRDCMLGWDVTDFGSDDFAHIGRTLFTLRNGSIRDARYPKTYGEKLLLDPEGQRAPAHFHRSKREDIINRAGGNVMVYLYLADEHDQRSSEPFTIQVDGQMVPMQPGGMIRLAPGQSVSLPPRTIHQFWAEEGTGWLVDGVGYSVSGEVSSTVNDWTDNYFLGPLVRFPQIEEDEPRLRYLCQEYPPVRS